MTKILIIHGTEGYPEENWFPWLKEKLEAEGHTVIVPQFPTPPVVAAKVSEWFEVLKQYENMIDDDMIIIGHSLGGLFTLRILEKILTPIKAAVFVSAPVGVRPVLNYERDVAFSGFEFNWDVIRRNALQFVVFHSDDDPYVALANGEELAKKLGVELNFIPNAGHFNTKAGYTEFQRLKDVIDSIVS